MNAPQYYVMVHCLCLDILIKMAGYKTGKLAIMVSHKGKCVKVTLVQTLRLCTGRTAHRGSRGIALLRLCTGRTAHRGSRGRALLFHDQGSEGSASRPGRSLPPGKTRYPLYRRLGGPQGRCGQVRKISPPPGFDPRTVQPVAIRYTD